MFGDDDDDINMADHSSGLNMAFGAASMEDSKESSTNAPDLDPSAVYDADDTEGGSMPMRTDDDDANAVATPGSPLSVASETDLSDPSHSNPSNDDSDPIAFLNDYEPDGDEEDDDDGIDITTSPILSGKSRKRKRDSDDEDEETEEGKRGSKSKKKKKKKKQDSTKEPKSKKGKKGISEAEKKERTALFTTLLNLANSAAAHNRVPNTEDSKAASGPTSPQSSTPFRGLNFAAAPNSNLDRKMQTPAANAARDPLVHAQLRLPDAAGITMSEGHRQQHRQQEQQEQQQRQNMPGLHFDDAAVQTLMTNFILNGDSKSSDKPPKRPSDILPPGTELTPNQWADLDKEEESTDYPDFCFLCHCKAMTGQSSTHVAELINEFHANFREVDIVSLCGMIQTKYETNCRYKIRFKELRLPWWRSRIFLHFTKHVIDRQVQIEQDIRKVDIVRERLFNSMEVADPLTGQPTICLKRVEAWMKMTENKHKMIEKLASQS